jgi:hypothetical protein
MNIWSNYFLNKEIARRFVMARLSINRRPSPLSLLSTAQDAKLRSADQGRTKMRKTVSTIAVAALIAASTAQFASAASGRPDKTHQRHPATQFRNSNAYVAPAYVAVQPEWSGSNYNYSGGYSAPAGR